MKQRGIYCFSKNEKGATLVEFSLIAPLLFALTFGIADFGALFYQYQALNAATAVAARMAATRGPIVSGIPDCGVGTTVPIGSYCSFDPVSRTWTPLTCTGTATAPTPATSGTACNVTLMNRIVTEMRLYYRPLTANNVSVTYGPSGMGFSGAGKPAPMVTVTISGVNASFLIFSAFGLNPITLPPFTTTLPAEDLSGT